MGTGLTDMEGGRVAEDADSELVSLVVAWFQQRPSGAVISWSSIDVGTERPWATEDVDVYIPELARLLGLNWVFTILPEADPIEAASLTFAYPYDDASRQAWSAEQISRALSAWVTCHAGRSDLQFTWDPGAEPSPVVREVLRRLAALKADPTAAMDFAPGVVMAPEALSTAADSRKGLRRGYGRTAETAFLRNCIY